MKKINFWLIIFGLVWANFSWAFFLSPTEIEMEIMPGNVINLELEIQNPSENPLHCRVFPGELTISPEGNVVLLKANPKYSAKSWITIVNQEIDIEGKARKKINVVISPPKSAQSHDYFASIIAVKETVFIGRGEQREISGQVIAQNVCFARITIPGRKIQKPPTITEIKTQVSETKEIKIFAVLQNNGEIRLDGIGKANIKNSEGKIVDEFFLQGANKAKGMAFVQPENIRNFWGTVQKPLVSGEYSVQVNFGYSFNKFKEAESQANNNIDWLFRNSKKVKSDSQTKFMVSQDLGKNQKELLTISAVDLLEIVLPQGAVSRTLYTNIANNENQAINVKVESNVEWLKISPTSFTIQGKQKTLRLDIAIPPGEPVQRKGLITIIPERGKILNISINILEWQKEKK